MITEILNLVIILTNYKIYTITLTIKYTNYVYNFSIDYKYKNYGNLKNLE